MWLTLSPFFKFYRYYDQVNPRYNLLYVTVPRKRDLFRNKVKNELFIPLCRALLMEYFDIKFIGRRSLVH